MANKTDKFEDNKPGKYYIDGSCTACRLCCDTVPEFFQFNEDQSHAFVSAQPQTAEEVDQCEQARKDCPADCIGNDGD